ncbi:hypothetical protein ACKWTF_015647 [Chironomus riparius]
MTSKCSVANCHFQSKVCFHSPQSRPHLELWKKILNINVDKFFVCDQHFEDKFFRIEKRLTFDAFPTQYIGNFEEGSSDFCQCCMKSFVRSKFITQYEPRVTIDEKLQQDFTNVIGCEIPSGVMCTKCFENIKTFLKFRSEVREKQKVRDEIFELKTQQETHTDFDPNFKIKEEPKDDDELESTLDIQEETYSDPMMMKIKDEPMDDEEFVIKEEKIDLGCDENYLISEIKAEPEEMQDTTAKPTSFKFTQAVPKQKILIRRPTSGMVVRPTNLQNFKVVQPQNVVRVVKRAASPQISQKITNSQGTIKISQVQLSQMENSTNMLGYKCQYCPNRFIEKRFVVDHIKQKHTFPCNQCTSVFPFKITLIKHQMSFHGNSTGQHVSKSAAYKHVCRICGLKFLSNYTLDAHMTQRHQRAMIEEKMNSQEDNENIIIIRPLVIPSKSSTSGSSTLFKKLPTTPKQQSSSLPFAIKNEDYKPIIKIFPTPTPVVKKPVKTLVRRILTPVGTTKPPQHEPVVEDPDGIPCLDCGLLLRPDKLLKHRMDAHDLNTHNMYYLCDMCGTEIKGKTQLINHMTTKHLSANFVRCEFCDGLFDNITDVICHKNLQHNFNGTRYTCHFCYKIFSNKREMILHRKAHYSEKESRQKLARVFCKKFKSYEPKGVEYK